MQHKSALTVEPNHTSLRRHQSVLQMGNISLIELMSSSTTSGGKQRQMSCGDNFHKLYLLTFTVVYRMGFGFKGLRVWLVVSKYNL